MLKTIRMITIMGLIFLPVASFGSSEGDAKSDTDLAAKIQKAIAKDPSFSADAANVNVVVQDGVVTLKGTVRSDEERAAMQAKAESLVIQATPIDRIHTVVVHNELALAP
jgi:hypothetical protein